MEMQLFSFYKNGSSRRDVANDYGRSGLHCCSMTVKVGLMRPFTELWQKISNQ